MTPASPARVGAPKTVHVPGDPFAATGAICAKRLQESLFNRFVKDDSDTNVTVLEVLSDGFPQESEKVQKRDFQSTKSLITHCRANVAPRLRIISIPQITSYSELEITRNGMKELLEVQDVSTDFLDVLYAAGKPPKESEEGFGQAIETRHEDGSFSLAYLSRYYGHRDTAWKLRQTGVYHAYSATEHSNIFFLLHPSEQSEFQKVLENFAAQAGSAAALAARPTRIHAMLLSAYFDNWRVFLRKQGDSFATDADQLFVAKISDPECIDISPEKLRSLRELEDRIMPLTSMFQALLELLDILEDIDRNFTGRVSINSAGSAGVSDTVKSESNFGSRKGPVKALMTSSAGLQKRIHGVLSLLTNTLEMRNHKALTDTNNHLLKLQWENVEDNDTVQIITVVTLMYLPASFVATLFGMNLFGFNQKTARIRVAKDFWLYVAIMVPLTFATVFYWLIRTRESRAKRQERLGNRSRQAKVAIPKNWFHMQQLSQNSKIPVAASV